MSRRPLELSGGCAPSGEELSIAAQVIDRSGLVEILSPHLDAEVGRHRSLSPRGLLVVFQVNALRRGHAAHLIDVARILNAMSDGQRRSLGIDRWEPRFAYRRVVFMVHKLCALLDTGIDGIDANWFANTLARAAIPKRHRTSASLAIDGTDVETWGAFQGSTTSLLLDGEAVDAGDDERFRRPPIARAAKVLAIGPDGRRQYTPDPDARAGHRSWSGQHSSGPYIGYELHLAVQARALKWTNYVDRTTFGPEVPNVITNVSLVPAGSHRTRSIVPQLLAAKKGGQAINEGGFHRSAQRIL